MTIPQFAVTLASRIIVACVILGASHAHAQAASDDGVVLVSNSLARVTRAEYNAELLKLPIDLRAGFANNPRRVNDLLMRMLVQKSLASQARAAKLDATPEAAARIELEVERQLSQIMIESVEVAAAAEFDANRGRFEARARELYILEKGKYATPEQVSATHILFDTKKRTSEEARALARETRAKIAAGADMGKLARDLSDDPSSGNNSGTLGWFAKADMDPAFGEAAFALKNTGDLSEPVLSQFGWHVIRLDGRRPANVKTFDEARETVMFELRKRYVDEKREEAVNAVRRDPKTQINREAVDALTPRIDLEAARRALGMTPSGAPSAPAPAVPR